MTLPNQHLHYPLTPGLYWQMANFRRFPQKWVCLSNSLLYLVLTSNVLGHVYYLGTGYTAGASSDFPSFSGYPSNQEIASPKVGMPYENSQC